MSSRPKRFYRERNARVANVMRELYFVGHMKQTDIARMFGCPQGSVSRIVSKRVWGDR
jgi:DNA-binding transcriptional regulator LsrR (DeoR family)